MQQKNELINSLKYALPYMSIIIGALGLCVMIYTINLRFDALLYARTINGIRKYFAEKSELNINQLFNYHVLPLSIYRPPYFEPSYFLIVVFGFALINTGYFIFAIWMLFNVQAWILILSIIIGIIIHVSIYKYLAFYRETKYFNNLPLPTS
jgi:hypothetical protein